MLINNNPPPDSKIYKSYFVEFCETPNISMIPKNEAKNLKILINRIFLNRF